MSARATIPLLSALVAGYLLNPSAASAASCESLRTLTLPHTTITVAESFSTTVGMISRFLHSTASTTTKPSKRGSEAEIPSANRTGYSWPQP